MPTTFYEVSVNTGKTWLISSCLRTMRAWCHAYTFTRRIWSDWALAILSASNHSQSRGMGLSGCRQQNIYIYILMLEQLAKHHLTFRIDHFATWTVLNRLQKAEIKQAKTPSASTYSWFNGVQVGYGSSMTQICLERKGCPGGWVSNARLLLRSTSSLGKRSHVCKRVREGCPMAHQKQACR